MLKRSLFIVTALAFMTMGHQAFARTVTAGEVWAHAGIGYSGVSSDNLSAGNHSLALHTELEFDLSRWGGLLGGLAFDFSSSTQVDLEAGLRLRIPGLESAWAPHLDVAYAWGLYKYQRRESFGSGVVTGAPGTEFFLTRDLMAGISLEWTRKEVTSIDSYHTP